ncbi:hypothetical protein, partial [Pseudomonas neuropathica]|uniref:hypothetical protein n=1 Tax=Pseudomonas neuropathica TaxID=2730425 RepID=UPI003F75BDC1
SARKVEDGSTQWNDNGARNWNGGGMHASHDYGFGKVDARAAVRLAESWMTQSTGANLTSGQRPAVCLDKLTVLARVSRPNWGCPLG